LYLGIVLGVVVILTGLFGFYQEFKSNEAMASFKNYVPAKSTVVRNGRQIEVLSEEIVVGDIVILK
jgi:magnesium-transporting ATPase (P-type)